MQQYTILKLGGSAFSHSDSYYDFAYLQLVKDFLHQQVEGGKKIVLVVGGGSLAKEVMNQARSSGIAVDRDLHSIGRTACILNAEVVRAFIGEIAEENIIKNHEFTSDILHNSDKQVLVAGGSLPGVSSDMGASILAVKFGAKRVVSIKNIDGVYTADPAQNPDATIVGSLTWVEYMDIIGNKSKHEPRGNYPVDPVTAKHSMDNKVEWAIVGNSNFENIASAINYGEFKGSLIV